MIYVILAAVLVVCSIVAFSLYAIDKKRAKSNQWRIKESTLIASAFLMGGIGAMLGMSLLRHKTQHIQFKLLVPIATILNIAVVVAILFLTGSAPF